MSLPNCCDVLAWAQVFTDLPVTAIVAFFTWFATSRLTKRSERRKELLSEIDKLCRKVDNIHRLAYQYHTSEKEEKDLASEILVMIKILSEDLSNANLLQRTQVCRLMIGLRRAVTLENFDTCNFSAKQLRDPLIKRIDEACAKLKKSIDESRHT
ncbi:hypothetical protein [Marichromatium sp. AB32]|uniref:hypothetical protein n=1 Tax=Marichromatium sp. AB32 TaxID=2483363 RepID=UPI0011CE718D|nr:hypothetical protein [Marichromatium sp. AB32]